MNKLEEYRLCFVIMDGMSLKFEIQQGGVQYNYIDIFSPKKVKTRN